MAHIIIFDRIDELQGSSVTGTGSLERLKVAVAVSEPWESYELPSKDQQECLDCVSRIADAIQGAFGTGDVTSWCDELEGLNAAALLP